MFRIFERVASAAALVAAAGSGLAQEDLTLPPRILDSAPASQARLADGPAREPTDIEEIVVTGDDNPWRLPDLGSEWRARMAEQPPEGRIAVDAFPLWDPEAERPMRDLFPVGNEQRVGFIEVFRIRFGRR